MGNRLKFLYLQVCVISEVVTEKAKIAGCWKCRFKEVGGDERQIPRLDNTEIRIREAKPRKVSDAMLPRKPT